MIKKYFKNMIKLKQEIQNLYQKHMIENEMAYKMIYKNKNFNLYFVIMFIDYIRKLTEKK